MRLAHEIWAATRIVDPKKKISVKSIYRQLTPQKHYAGNLKEQREAYFREEDAKKNGG